MSTLFREERRYVKEKKQGGGPRHVRNYFEAADPNCYRQSIPACVYILDEGRRRPCPAGEGCTVRSPMPQGLSSYRRRHRAIIEAFMLARSRSGRGGL